MNPVLLRALLAALPLLGVTLEWENGFVYGGMVVGILFLSALIFSSLSFVIPQPLYRISFLLPLILGAAGIEIILGGRGSPAPLLLASVCLLTNPDLFRNQKNWTRVAKKTFLASLYFWMLVTGHGILCDLLGSGMGIRFFQIPAGSFLLIGMALALIPKQRRISLRAGG